jgi:hypothetical protein
LWEIGDDPNVEGPALFRDARGADAEQGIHQALRCLRVSEDCYLSEFRFL